MNSSSIAGMLYFIFMKKQEKDRSPFAIQKVIDFYMQNFYNNDFVVSIPGYMSTSQSIIDIFCSTINLGSNVYFAKGMNGHRLIHGLVPATTIQDYHNKKYTSLSTALNKKHDHSKMLFFLDDKSIVKETGKVEIDKENIIVKAVLIGSSNQSYNTYLLSPSPKGEADLFIIDSKSVPQNVNKSIKDLLVEFYDSNNAKEERKNIVISEQICGENHDFLLEIFKTSIEL